MDSIAVKKDEIRTHEGAKPIKLLRRIGSTTYEVTVHYNNANKTTMSDIIRRVLEREVDGVV